MFFAKIKQNSDRSFNFNRKTQIKNIYFIFFKTKMLMIINKGLFQQKKSKNLICPVNSLSMLHDMNARLKVANDFDQCDIDGSKTNLAQCRLID
jgi:hypothetical protein